MISYTIRLRQVKWNWKPQECENLWKVMQISLWPKAPFRSKSLRMGIVLAVSQRNRIWRGSCPWCCHRHTVIRRFFGIRSSSSRSGYRQLFLWWGMFRVSPSFELKVLEKIFHHKVFPAMRGTTFQWQNHSGSDQSRFSGRKPGPVSRHGYATRLSARGIYWL